MKKNNYLHRNFKSNNVFRNCLIVLSVSLAICQTTNAQIGTFPFDPIPANFSVTINLLSNTARPFNNKLLGVNFDINAVSGPEGGQAYEYIKQDESNVGKVGLSATKCKAFFNMCDPVSLRFPTGYLGNLYHWRDFVDPNDPSIIYPEDTFVRYDVKPSFEELPSHNRYTKAGYPGLVDLHNNPTYANKGFDILTILNINNDDNVSSKARVRKMLNDNLGVRDFELGNEFFWGNQKSNTIATEQQYIARAKLVVAAVKDEFASRNINNMKFGIPVGQHTGLPGEITDFTNYNNLMTADKTYYDAIIVHKYLNLKSSTSESVATIVRKTLMARKYMNDNVIESCRKRWGKNSDGVTYKDLWLTEWAVGVDEGGTKDWTASFLAMADTYLYFVENDDKYQRVNWFQVLNSNGFYKFNLAADRFDMTGFGKVNELLKNTLKNTTLYDVVLTAPQLQLGGVNQGVKAVSARIVKGADGKLRVIAVNLTNQTARLAIKFDGANLYSGSYTQNGVRYQDLNKHYDDVINVSTTGTGLASLPPYSVTVLTGITAPSAVNLKGRQKDQKEITSEIENNDSSIKVYPNPSETGVFTITNAGSWSVFNLSGSKVLEGKGEIVDLSRFSKGMYTLQTETTTHKLIYK